MLAVLDLRTGQQALARQRINDLVTGPNWTRQALAELLALSPRRSEASQMLQWADQAIRVDTLSPSQLTHLLHLRTTWACRSADWSSALSFLDQLAQIQSDDARVDAARIALLCHLGRFTAARDVYLASPELIESPDGPLAAAAVGRHQDIELRDDYLALCLAACVRGDTVSARAAAARAPSIPPLFRSDLLDAVQK